MAEPTAEPDLERASYLAADDPVQGDEAFSAAFAAATPAEIEEAAAGAGLPGAGAPGANGSNGVTNRLAEDGETQMPIVKSDREKLGRNDPCWCGSKKKFKLCHGAN
jgi:preprotein translocase subunit SecA